MEWRAWSAVVGGLVSSTLHGWGGHHATPRTAGGKAAEWHSQHQHGVHGLLEVLDPPVLLVLVRWLMRREDGGGRGKRLAEGRSSEAASSSWRRGHFLTPWHPRAPTNPVSTRHYVLVSVSLDPLFMPTPTKRTGHSAKSRRPSFLSYFFFRLLPASPHCHPNPPPPR